MVGGLGLNLFTGSSEDKNYSHMQGFPFFQKSLKVKKNRSFMTENLISDFLNPSQDFPFF